MGPEMSHAPSEADDRTAGIGPRACDLTNDRLSSSEAPLGGRQQPIVSGSHVYCMTIGQELFPVSGFKYVHGFEARETCL